MERIVKREKCAIYSFGAPNLTSYRVSSFKAALVDRAPGCEVWRYDFAVDSERGRNAHGPEDSLKYYTFGALMKLNGGPASPVPSHAFIDVLKIDVEGAEFDTLTVFLETYKLLSSFSSTTLPIGQLQIELRARDDYGNFDFFHDWWAALEAVGMRPFWTESNLVFVNYNAGGR
ncbi:hypothetical protein EDB83DRAFT_2328480, partial [Lactarius deliciosus]